MAATKIQVIYQKCYEAIKTIAFYVFYSKYMMRVSPRSVGGNGLSRSRGIYSTFDKRFFNSSIISFNNKITLNWFAYN